MLSKEEVIKVSHLARIALTEAEVEKFQTELSQILDYVDDLSKVNTEGLEIVSSVTGLENISRTDEPKPTNYQSEILRNAPNSKDGYYKVKSIL